MLESLIQIGMCIVLASSVYRSLMTGQTFMWTKALQRSERPVAFWALAALQTLIAVGSGYYGIEGLL